MKRWILSLAVVLITASLTLSGAFAGDAAKSDASKADAKKDAKAQAFTGEVVDMGCYLAHGAVGEKHAECARKCVADGMPIGLLTEGDKLFLLTPNHDDLGPYASAKSLAAKQVTITGHVIQRGGAQAIEVTKAEPVADSDKTPAKS